MKSRISCLVRALSCAAVVTSAASAQSFICVSNSVSMRAEYATADSVVVGSNPLPSNEWGPEFYRDLDGTAYAITNSHSIFGNPGLYRVNEFTGELTWLRNIAVNLADTKKVTGAAVDATTGKSYLLLNLNGLMVLCRFEPSTGSITGQWLLPYSSNLLGLAFDSQNVLYTLDFQAPSSPSLRSLDVQNPLNSTIIGTSLGLSYTDTNITFDEHTGRLIGLANGLLGGPSTVFEIDRSTGTALNSKTITFDGGTFFVSSVLATTCSGLGSFGAGCVGSGAMTPKLTIDGCPFAGNAVELSLTGALGASTAIFAFGVGPSSIPPIPMGGGCFLLLQTLGPYPLSIPTLGVGPGNGFVVLSATLPLSWSGINFATQAFVADPANPIGASATNGVKISIP